MGLRAGTRRDDSPGSCCRLDRMFTASRPPVPPRWADVRRLRLCPHRVTPPGLSADESCTTKSQVDDDSCQPIGIRPAFLQAAACPPPRRPRRAHARPEQGAHDAAGAAAAPRRGHSGKRGHAEGDGAEASGADPGGNLHKSEMARNTTLGGGRLCRHHWGACRGGSNFLSDAPHPRRRVPCRWRQRPRSRLAGPGQDSPSKHWRGLRAAEQTRGRGWPSAAGGLGAASPLWGS